MIFCKYFNNRVIIFQYKHKKEWAKVRGFCFVQKSITFLDATLNNHESFKLTNIFLCDPRNQHAEGFRMKKTFSFVADLVPFEFCLDFYRRIKNCYYENV